MSKNTALALPNVISLVAIKGGVGKTTLAYNFAEWLASKNKRVLLIDLDEQCSLTHRYDVFTNQNTVFDILMNAPTKSNKILAVKPNIDLIPGSMHLDNAESAITSKADKDVRLLRWLIKHKQDVAKHDYIIVDTHPGMGVATKNAILISDVIFSPITPSADSYQAHFDLEFRLKQLRKEESNPITGESYVDCKLFYIINQLKKNTDSSRVLLDQVKKQKNVVAKIPEKELFNKSGLLNKPVVDFAKTAKY